MRWAARELIGGAVITLDVEAAVVAVTDTIAACKLPRSLCDDVPSPCCPLLPKAFLAIFELDTVVLLTG